MNQKVWSGLASALLTVALSATSSCHAETSKVEANKPEPNPVTAANSPSPQENSQPVEAVKVGESQSSADSKDQQANAIAKIHSHELEGRQAVTLYVREIPVLTFIGASHSRTSDTKVGQSQSDRATAANSAEPSNLANDPVARASAVAAKINQLDRDNVDASTIAVSWDGSSDASKTVDSVSSQNNNPQGVLYAFGDRKKPIAREANSDRYVIKVNGEKLVEIDVATRLPDTTNNLAQDALQAANRLRRLMGNAAPLTDIPNKPTPKPVQTAFVTAIKSTFRGMASWYGPGFHGNLSASGERYNQNALTAAHRSLPFGTKVRVTNLNNGLSVVVRINDRGPYIRGRVIDLSAASARMLGMMGSGVAPVRLDVLGDTTETVTANPQ